MPACVWGSSEVRSAPLCSWSAASRTRGTLGGRWGIPEEREPEDRSDLCCSSRTHTLLCPADWEELGGQALGILEETMTKRVLGPRGYPQGSPALLSEWAGPWGCDPGSLNPGSLSQACSPSTRVRISTHPPLLSRSQKMEITRV